LHQLVHDRNVAVRAPTAACRCHKACSGHRVIP
jgi:hypothetical protein